MHRLELFVGIVMVVCAVLAYDPAFRLKRDPPRRLTLLKREPPQTTTDEGDEEGRGVQ